MRFEPRVRQAVALNLGRTVASLEQDDDLVQQTWVETIEGLPTLEYLHEGAFVAWLVRITENTVRQAARTASTRKRGEGRVQPLSALGSSVLSDSILQSRDASPSQLVRGREREELLERILLGLPERDRRDLTLRRVLGVPDEDIARELGVETATVRSICHRAIGRIGASLPPGLSPLRT